LVWDKPTGKTRGLFGFFGKKKWERTEVPSSISAKGVPRTIESKEGRQKWGKNEKTYAGKEGSPLG